AVFVPVTFLGGLTGQLYRQFAVTISVSVAISGLVALTLSPALCRLLLKPTHGKKFILFRWFNSFFDGITRGFTFGVKQALRFSIAMLIIFGILTYVTVQLSRTVPTGLVPQEDQGYIIAMFMLPDGVSLTHTDKVAKEVEEFFLSQPQVQSTVLLGGMDFASGGITSTSAATMFVRLKDFKD